MDPLSDLCWLLQHLQLIGMIGSPLRQPTPADRCQIISSLPVVTRSLTYLPTCFVCLYLFPRSPHILAEKSISSCDVADQHCTLESHQHLVVVNKPFSQCVCWRLHCWVLPLCFKSIRNSSPIILMLWRDFEFKFLHLQSKVKAWSESLHLNKSTLVHVDSEPLSISHSWHIHLRFDSCNARMRSHPLLGLYLGYIGKSNRFNIH